MIELVTASSGTTKMDVWSPLSSAPVTTSSCSGGSTFSTSTPFIQNISLPADGVIYVQSYTLPAGASAPVVNDGSAPCFNPYQVAQTADSSTCLEGDVYVEGELQGQLTIASAANIIITRDTTYNCVDGNNSASSTNPDTVAVCTTPPGGRSPDILGLSALEDVVVAHNNPVDQVTQSSQDCSSSGFGDGTNTPVGNASGLPTSSMLTENPYNGQQVSNVHVSNGSTTVTLSSGNFVNDGIPNSTAVAVSGSGIPAGTTVANISGGSLTLSTAATSSSGYNGETLTFTDPGLANDPVAIWPTLCDTIGSSGIYVDAAVFALHGSFGVQNWNMTPFSNYVNLNGTDLSEYRGPFGQFGGGGGTEGYEKSISFDQRLGFISPPFIIPGSVPLWVLNDYVECPNSSCPAIG